jgi:hypothetical protein
LSIEDFNKLFGDLRSALGKNNILEVHNISKQMIKTDHQRYQSTVANYVSSELDSQGDSVDQNTRIRIEHFKAWVRDSINSEDSRIKSEKISLFKQLLYPQDHDMHLVFREGKYLETENNIQFPSSVRFKTRPSRYGSQWYYLSEEFQDALWVVLDEHGLL